MAATLRKSDLDVFRVHAPADAFTRVYHEIIDNRDLTPHAKLLITHMLDQARKGEVYDIDRETIAYWLGSGSEKGFAGRHVVSNAIANAKACGFVLSERDNSPSDGLFITHWYVTEVRGHFNKSQMTLPFTGDDPPEGRASPMSDFPTSDDPATDQPTTDQPTAENPAAEAAHHGLMVNGFDGLERARGKDGFVRRSKSRGGRRLNAVGGPCLRDLNDSRIFTDDDPPALDIQRLFALYRAERARLAIDSETVTTRQFVAAAVRAKNVVAREGGNVLALFAAIINRRGANPQAPAKHWVVIQPEEWREAELLLDQYKASQENVTKMQAVRMVAEQRNLDPFHVAAGEQFWPGLTRSEWEQMERMYPC